MKKKMFQIITVLALSSVGLAETKTIRATQLDNNFFTELNSGKLGEVIIEFRDGDELPFTVNAEGDFLEVSKPAVSYIKVKRNFQIKLIPGEDNVFISLGGDVYKPINKIVSGQFTLGANSTSGTLANSLSMSLKAYLK